MVVVDVKLRWRVMCAHCETLFFAVVWEDTRAWERSTTTRGRPECPKCGRTSGFRMKADRCKVLVNGRGGQSHQ